MLKQLENVRSKRGSIGNNDIDLTVDQTYSHLLTRPIYKAEDVHPYPLIISHHQSTWGVRAAESFQDTSPYREIVHEGSLPWQ